MRHWDLLDLEVEPHRPEVLHSSRGEARAIAISLAAGEQLGDHQVHERAFLTVIDGAIDVEAEETVSLSRGGLVVLDPTERHEVRATADARLLLILAPWPGEGHPGARDA